MNKSIILFVDNTQKSFEAEKLLNKSNIKYAQVFDNTRFDILPKIISRGVAYRGLSGVKAYIGMNESLKLK